MGEGKGNWSMGWSGRYVGSMDHLLYNGQVKPEAKKIKNSRGRAWHGKQGTECRDVRAHLIGAAGGGGVIHSHLYAQPTLNANSQTLVARFFLIPHLLCSITSTLDVVTGSSRCVASRHVTRCVTVSSKRIQLNTLNELRVWQEWLFRENISEPLCLLFFHPLKRLINLSIFVDVLVHFGVKQSPLSVLWRH